MTVRATFTLENESFAFLRVVAGNNRSAFINRLIQDEKRHMLDQKILRANQEEAEDQEYQQALHDWEAALLDGLTP